MQFLVKKFCCICAQVFYSWHQHFAPFPTLYMTNIIGFRLNPSSLHCPLQEPQWWRWWRLTRTTPPQTTLHCATTLSGSHLTIPHQTCSTLMQKEATSSPPSHLCYLTERWVDFKDCVCMCVYFQGAVWVDAGQALVTYMWLMLPVSRVKKACVCVICSLCVWVSLWKWVPMRSSGQAQKPQEGLSISPSNRSETTGWLLFQ